MTARAISDATIERAQYAYRRVIAQRLDDCDGDLSHEQMLAVQNEAMRAALESVGYEEARAIIETLADEIDSLVTFREKYTALVLRPDIDVSEEWYAERDYAHHITESARAWSSRYTPEPK